MAILFLIVFALRPAYFVGYFSYFQLNIDYFVENYCVNKNRPELQCNGKCYLMEQLSVSKEQQRNQNATNAGLTLIEAFIPLFMESYVDFSFQYYEHHIKSQILSPFYLKDSLIIKEMLRPPII